MEQNDGEFLKKSNFCKNHQEIPSKYFITDQPWLKYCKDCAFNIALCGKKIEKQLTVEQFDRKMIISSIAAEFKKNIEDIQENNHFCNHLTTMLEEVSKPMQEKLQQIQIAIAQLFQAKQKLKNVYHREISDKIRQFFEKQGRIALNCMEIKKQLQIIESNYGNFIQLQNSEEFEFKKSRWNNILNENRQDLLNEKDYNEIHDKLLENIQAFYIQFENITQFKIKTSYDKKEDKLQKISCIEEEFNMTLTPIEANSLNASLTADNMKLNMKNKGQLKLRSNRKMNTDRQTKTSSKTATKRSIIYGSQNASIQMLMSNKKNYR